MTILLSEQQEFILKELATNLTMLNAEFTPLIGRQPGAESDRKHAAFVSRLLLDLEQRGLIARADSGKPILWRLKR
ncbi:MAG: hypothetical protein WC322_00280 [Candidatus Paceibacterota bacterium]|jgi:hypothetical protein